MSQVPSDVTVCLLPAHSFDISRSDFLESDILKVEVLIKHSFNHKGNWFHLKLVPHSEKHPGFFK